MPTPKNPGNSFRPELSPEDQKLIAQYQEQGKPIAGMPRGTLIPGFWTQELITPQKAEQFLAKNIDANRKVAPEQVTKWARLYGEDLWHVNGDTIRFDSDGRLFDGQHRLLACISSGIPFVAMVVRELHTKAVDGTDAGKKRNASDVLAMHGIGNGNRVASIVRFVNQWEGGERSINGFRGGRAQQLTNDEVMQVIFADPDYIDSVRGTGNSALLRLAPPRVLGFLHYQLHRADAQKAELFFDYLQSGAGMDKGHPVLTLRNYWTNLTGRNMASKPGLYVNAGVRAWNKFLQGQSWPNVTYKSSYIPEILTDEQVAKGELPLDDAA